ncbi:DUF222 domain-containing protein, partial [Burkholderia cenocepacia]|uniref:DUF222 domain-containing protein n=1 Tax=Burkholderia cenocepacia TaxID=95486 RepID=UPI0038CC0E38
MAQEIEHTGHGPDAVLDVIQANALSQLDAIRTGRQALEAHEWRVLAALGHLAIERAGSSNSERIAMSMRSMAAEVGVQSRVSDRTVEARIGEAMTLVGTWPALVEAFAAGRIGRGHVRVITDAGAPLASSDVTPAQRAAYAVDMVAVAETTTPGRLA